MAALAKNGWCGLTTPGFKAQFLAVRRLCGDEGSESPVAFLVPDHMRELLGWPIGELTHVKIFFVGTNLFCSW